MHYKMCCFSGRSRRVNESLIFMIYRIIAIITVCLLFCGILGAQDWNPCIAFSFDDGNPDDILSYRGSEWNGFIRDQLKEFNIQAVWFVAAGKLDNEKGKILLKKWDDAGHIIANHTYSHLNYNDPSISCDQFVQNVLKCDAMIKEYNNYRKIFRFPYLKTGDSIKKRDDMRKWLAYNNYRQGWVTIDTSDWYYNMRLIKRLKEKPNTDLSGFRKTFVEHIYDKAKYYNEMSKEINLRQIHHTLLLHFNLTSALFLKDLIQKFKAEGWKIENYGNALDDPVYDELPDAMPAEQSLVWLQARKTGMYEDRLRYPGENGEYEKKKLDNLGW